MSELLKIPNIANKIISKTSILAFIVAIMVFLITTNVRLAFNSVDWYKTGFERHNVSYTTGLNATQLSNIAQDISSYFNSDQDYLVVIVQAESGNRELFNENEKIHMKDVKVLVKTVYQFQILSGLYAMLYSIVIFTIYRRTNPKRLLNHLIYSGVFTSSLVLLVGVLASISFSYLFEQFHVLSFDNDLWQLDPRYNYLTRLFTEAFFFESTILVGISSIIQSIILIFAGLLGKKYIN